jgi:hypothetical protein
MVKFSTQVMPLNVTTMIYNFYSDSFKHFKIAEVQTSEVDAKGAPANLV